MTIELTRPTAHEQTRARYPDESGYVEREGVKLFYEVCGSGEPTVFLLPTWSIIHSRHWKMQIPYPARHCRVLTFDGRGNGRSDRPANGYDESEFAADALAVMDATGTERSVLVSLSLGAQRALLLAADQPERVGGAVFICPSVPIGEPVAERQLYPWNEKLDTDEDWAKYNRYYWLRDYRGFLEFFFSQMFTEPHSTKPIEDCVGWGLETTPETLVATQLRDWLDEEAAREVCARVRCPVLVIQGTDDAITGPGRGIALAEATGGDLVLLEGSGHGPHVRDPVKVNLLLRGDFVKPAPPPRRWVRGKSRRKRALYISSPIGLGHAQRDAAIAVELQNNHASLRIRQRRHGTDKKIGDSWPICALLGRQLDRIEWNRLDPSPPRDIDQTSARDGVQPGKRRLRLQPSVRESRNSRGKDLLGEIVDILGPRTTPNKTLDITEVPPVARRDRIIHSHGLSQKTLERNIPRSGLSAAVFRRTRDRRTCGRGPRRLSSRRNRSRNETTTNT